MKQPNIVFVLTDDQGYGDLGCTGNPIIKTPTIDRFYEESVRLTDYHVGPTCAPTRSGLMTGHYANSTGVWHTIGGRSLLRQNEWTLANALKENGYRTGIFGKWHLGDTFPYRPMDRGFEETVVHGGGGISQVPDHWGNDYFDDTYFVNGEATAFEGYCTDVFFDQALAYIEDHKDEPFFCCITPNAPHSPYNVDRKYSAPYMDKTHEARARFYGMITNIDDNFARLEQKLEELNLSDQTILVFMTDNGTSCGAGLDPYGFVTEGYNAGLRGVKNSEYDGGHRVPFFIRWPDGGIYGGKDYRGLAANVDFMPTLLDLCGIDGSKADFHGISLAKEIKGEKAPEERVVVTDSQRVAYPVKWRKSAVMTERWRLVNGKELYDINEDREQRKDISHFHPAVVEDLRQAYDQWWALVSDQFDKTIPFELTKKPIQLTGHDLRNEECDTIWTQGQVRQGKRIAGYYEIEVKEAGTYEFSLRRWPEALNHPISAGITDQDVYYEKDFIMEGDWHNYTGGEALPIQYARISIQGQSATEKVAESDRETIISLTLREGETRLVGQFLDGNHKVVTSPFYIGVKRLG